MYGLSFVVFIPGDARYLAWRTCFQIDLSVKRRKRHAKELRSDKFCYCESQIWRPLDFFRRVIVFQLTRWIFLPSLEDPQTKSLKILLIESTVLEGRI